MKKKTNSNLSKKSAGSIHSKNYKELLKAEHRLNKLLLDSLPHPAMLIDKTRKVIAANKEAFNIGVIIGDYCWKEFGKCLCLSDENKKLAEQNPDDPTIQCTFCMADDMFKNMEAKNDGEVYAFDLLWDTYWIPLDDEIYLHYAINITERNIKAENELRQSEKLLRQIADNYPNSYLSIIEKDFTIGFTSGQEFKKLSLAPEQFIGLKLEDVFGDKAPLVQKYYEKTFKGEEQSFELLINEQYQHYRTVPLYNEDGSIPRIMAVVENITERRKDKIALEESEKKHKALYDNINIALALHEIVTDENNKPVDFIWLDANPAYEKLTQLKVKDIIGKRGLEVIPNLEQKWIDTYGVVAQTGVPVTIIDHSEYQNKYWEVKAYSPKIGQFAVALTDITERKQAEDAIRESEEKLRLSIDNSPLGVCMNDMQGKFISTNQAYERMLGYSKEELLEMSFFDVTHPEDRPKNRNLFNDMFSNNAAGFNMEKRYICKDRSIINVLIHAGAIYDAEGKTSFGLAFIEDITDRKRSEEELKKNQYYLSKAQEIGSIGTWELDLIKNILLWTDENYKVFGVPLGTELNYEIFLNQIHPDDRDYVNEKWTAAVNNEPYDIEHRLIVDGKVKWVREKADVEFDENGVAVRGIGVTQDITHHKNSEEILKLKLEELERFNKAMVDRELKMIDLKREVNRLCSKLNIPKKYSIPGEAD